MECNATERELKSAEEIRTTIVCHKLKVFLPQRGASNFILDYS
jgi:hypothetical protein